MTPRRAVHLTCLVIFATAAVRSAEAERARFDPERLPASLRGVPLERLSSGALLRLDRAGELVEPPEAWVARLGELAAAAQKQRAAVVLDLRVGPNVRLGDDPPELPQTLRAQSEPHIVRAPNDPDFLLATFQEGRTTEGGAADCGYAVSHDGGLTWRRALIPDLAQPSGGPYLIASDPVAAIGADGVAYLNTLGVRSREPLTGTALVSRSLDGGATFEAPVVAYQSPNDEFFPDKNWIAVNSFPATPTAGRVAVTFTLISSTGAAANPIVCVRSDDRGQTWSAPVPIHDPATEAQGSQPAFLPDGKLAVSYWNFSQTPQIEDDLIELVISDDGGETFGPTKFVTAPVIYDHPRIRDAVVLPSMAASRGSGDLFIVWQATHAGSPRIMFTKSTDEGDTWTAPIPISDNPAGSPVINPAVAASPDGQTLTVMFYDARDNRDSATLLDIYLAQSFDGGATWQPNIRVTPVSTDAALAPMSGANPNFPNFMLGDYQGIAEATNADVPAVPLWIDTRTGNPDPFVGRIGISASVNFTAWQASRLSLGQINDPASGGEAGDADRDGEQNAVEYKYGTEPNDPLSVFHTGRLINISTRARVQTGENILIGGFIITGAEAKQVIVRAIGPSTASLGVAGPLEDPTLELFNGTGASIGANDDWRDSQSTEIEASGAAPADTRESAIIQTLPPGEYTAAVKGKNNMTGVALVEVFDLATGADPELANISTRSFVDTDENVMIGGFIVGAGEGTNSAGSARVLVRGLGPSLVQSGIVDALQDPELVLVNGNGEGIAFNDDWKQSQEDEIERTGAQPGDEREAAVLADLPGGNYTAILRGKNRTTGVGIIEAYNLP